MSSKKIVIFSAVSVATLFLSQIAYAGLFDDLKKLQQDLEQLQSGNMPEAPSGSGNTGALGMGSAATGGDINADAAGEDTVRSACRAAMKEGKVNAAAIFKTLPKPNIQLLKSDFSTAPESINTELNLAPKANELNADVANLELYRNAFETGEIASLFSQFLDTVGNKADYMSIMKQVANAEKGYDAKKNVMKRDAQQAYGIMLLYYQSRGANASIGLDYLKASSKGDSTKAMIATYQLGHRAYMGIEEPRNLSKAASWMLKSYEAVEERKRSDMRAQTSVPLSEAFIQLVTGEFLNLVADPAYKNRELYADLIQMAQSAHESMAQSMQNAKGRSPGIEAITKAYLTRESQINASIMRAIGQDAQATIEEQRLQKFADDLSKDAEKYNDFYTETAGTREFILSGLKKIDSLDANQKQKFSDAMRELALLTIEMKRIERYMISQMVRGQIDIMQMTLAAPVFTSVKVTCKLYDALNDVGTKMGTPKADVVFSSDAEDSVMNLGIKFEDEG